MTAPIRRFLTLVALSLIGSSCAPGQNIIMKDGRTISSKALRRQGNTIMATVDRPGTEHIVGKRELGEIGYALSQIAKIDFPRPMQLYTVPQLILQGKAADALAQIEPVIRYYEGFLDAPGSWWAEAALLKVQALVAMGKKKEAEPLIELVARTATDPETALAAKVFVGSTHTRKGEHAKAIEIQEAVLNGASNPMTLAAAAVHKGESHLALEQYEEAVLSYLQIPVFYPNERLITPQALLGLGRAFFALEDFPRARESLNHLAKAYESTPQAKEAQDELAKIARREKALAGPNP